MAILLQIFGFCNRLEMLYALDELRHTDVDGYYFDSEDEDFDSEDEDEHGFYNPGYDETPDYDEYDYDAFDHYFDDYSEPDYDYY